MEDEDSDWWSSLQTVSSFDNGRASSITHNNSDNEIQQFCPSSLLVESLIGQLCKLIENEPKHQKQLYLKICKKLHQMKLIDESYEMEEFESMRSYYQKALYHLVTAARSSVSPNDRSVIQRPSYQTVCLKGDNILEWSRYATEFEEEAFIAHGGFGQVFRARHKLDGELYAVKKIYLRYNNANGFMQSLTEVKMLAKLNHPNIVSYKAAWLEPLDSSQRNKHHFHDLSSRMIESSDSSGGIVFESSNLSGNDSAINEDELAIVKTTDQVADWNCTSVVGSQDDLDHIERHKRLLQYTDQLLKWGAGQSHSPGIDCAVQCELTTEPTTKLAHADSQDCAVQCELPPGECMDQRCVKIKGLVVSLRITNKLLEAEVQRLKSFFTLVPENVCDQTAPQQKTTPIQPSSQLKKKDVKKKVSEAKPRTRLPITSVEILGDSHACDLARLLKKLVPPIISVSGVCKPNAKLAGVFEGNMPRPQSCRLILAGSSDVAAGESENIFWDLEPQIERCLAAGAKVVVATLPRRYDLPLGHPVHRHTTLANIYIKEICRRLKVEVIDAHNIHRRWFTSHGMLLLPAGKQLLANMALKVLARTLHPAKTQRPTVKIIKEWACLYIQMQLCQSTLRQWLDNRNHQPEPVSESFCLKLFKKILRGMAFIHSQGIVHHDIKPSNIFVSEDLRQVQVGDFGLACSLVTHHNPEVSIVASHSQHRPGGGVGTKLYAAPEQLNSVCSPKSDIYSLGIVLFELILPFQTDMERSKVIGRLKTGHLPSDLSDAFPTAVRIIKQCIYHSPQRRPSSQDLLAMLEAEDGSTSAKIIAEKDEMISRLLIEARDRIREIEDLKRRVSELSVNSPEMETIRSPNFE